MTRSYKPRLPRPDDRFPPTCLDLVQQMWEGAEGAVVISARLAETGVEATARQVRDLAKRRGWQRPPDFNGLAHRHRLANQTPTFDPPPRESRVHWERWVWPTRSITPEPPARKGPKFPNSGFTMLAGRIR